MNNNFKPLDEFINENKSENPITIYRTNFPIISNKPTHGLLTPPKPHEHEFPNVFQRIWGRIRHGQTYRDGSLYRCSCGVFGKYYVIESITFPCSYVGWSVELQKNCKSEWIKLGGALLPGEEE